MAIDFSARELKSRKGFELNLWGLRSKPWDTEQGAISELKVLELRGERILDLRRERYERRKVEALLMVKTDVKRKVKTSSCSSWCLKS